MDPNTNNPNQNVNEPFAPAPNAQPPMQPPAPENTPAQSFVAPPSQPLPAMPTQQTVVAEQFAVPSPQAAPSQPAPADSIMDEYTSNPFLNAVRGLVLTLATNPVAALMTGFVSLILIVLAYLLLIATSNASPVLVFINVIVIILVFVLANGSFLAVGGASARNEKISTGEAFGLALKKSPGYLILNIILGFSIVLGLLLLVIPGLILIARSSLAQIAMFEEHIGPIAALKRSFKLTKGHTHEMLGAIFAGYFIGESYYSLLFGAISVSPMVGRYHDLRRLEESGAEKPPTHWLNYLYLLGILLIVGLIAGSILLAKDISSIKPTSFSDPTSNNYQMQGNSSFNTNSSSTNTISN